MHCLQKGLFCGDEAISLSHLFQTIVRCVNLCACVWWLRGVGLCIVADCASGSKVFHSLLSYIYNLQKEFINHTKSGLLCLCKLEYGQHCDMKIGSVVADSLITTIYALRYNPNGAG